jgi:hypothetical protein
MVVTHIITIKIEGFRNKVSWISPGELPNIRIRIVYWSEKQRVYCTILFLSRRRELNPRPADYESAAMPLSHGGAISHNIDACCNKICVSGIPAQRSDLLGTLRLFWGGYSAEL